MIELQQFVEEDFDRLIKWIDSPEICFLWAAQSLSYPINEKALTEHLNGTRNIPPAKAIFKAIDKQSLAVVGHIELDRIDFDKSSAEICRVFICPELQNKGLGTKMVKSLIDHSFSNLNLEELTLNVFDDNLRAIRAYEKAGLEKLGIRKAYVKYQNIDRDVLSMKITSGNWLKAQTGSFPHGQIDASLIEHTLALSYEERIDAHESAFQLVKDLQEAGRKFYARQP